MISEERLIHSEDESTVQIKSISKLLVVTV